MNKDSYGPRLLKVSRGFTDTKYQQCAGAPFVARKVLYLVKYGGVILAKPVS